MICRQYLILLCCTSSLKTQHQICFLIQSFLNLWNLIMSSISSFLHPNLTHFKSGTLDNGNYHIATLSFRTLEGRWVCRLISRSNFEEISQAETQTFLLYLTRAGWFISADFVDRVWTVHRTPADHWRALQLPFVLKQLSSLSDLIICQGCVEDEFHPSQCSQTNQTGGQCAVLLAGHRGSL